MKSLDEYRAEFEQREPVPEGVYWALNIGGYMWNTKFQINEAAEYNALWQGFLLAKPMLDAKDAEIARLREAAEVVYSNEEHAFSGGMRKYQKGSPTWQAYEDLRIALGIQP